MAKKKATRKKHHPDYDPQLEVGNVYLTREQAHAVVFAVACALEAGELDDPHYLKLRAIAAVDSLDSVFSLGVAEAGRRRVASSGKTGKAAAGSRRRRSRAASR
jgi:hypothetical protein